MNDRERAQIALILQRAAKFAGVTLDERIKAVYADHSSNGRLQSGATIKAAVDAMNAVLTVLISEMAQRVALVVNDKAAFGELNATLQQILDAFHERLPGVVQVASGRHGSETMDRSVVSATETLFSNWRSDLEAQIAILAYNFDTQAPEVETVSSPSVPSRKDKGGRPRADFWDDAWAATAAALYNGDLVPKTQADVEAAMANWIADQGFNASESSVRARARRLWDLISDPDA